jgi:hypothetical protein
LKPLNLAHDQVALDASKPVDEQPAVEVIHFVLEGTREQILAFEHELRAVAIVALDDRP